MDSMTYFGFLGFLAHQLENEHPDAERLNSTNNDNSALVVLRSTRSTHHLLYLNVGVFSESNHWTGPAHGSFYYHSVSGEIDANRKSLLFSC